MRASPRSQLIKLLGGFTIKDSKNIAEMEKVQQLYLEMNNNNAQASVKRTPPRKKKVTEQRDIVSEN